jgi:signal transduction histidine kinase
MDACVVFVNPADCSQAIEGDRFDDWIQAVLVDFARHAPVESDTVSTVTTMGSSRGPTVNSLTNILDNGESIYYGRCREGVVCDCFEGSTSFITSDPVQGALNSGILYSIAGTILGGQSSNYCSVTDNGIWLSYERSADLNLTTSTNYLISMLPVVGYSVLALLIAVLVVYLLLGRPLVILTAGLVKNRNWDPDSSLNIPYVKARHEIGTVARAFRYVLLRIRRQLDRERKLAVQLRIKSDRDRDINSIIAHEIKSPFHNLKNKYPDNLDITRIDSALEAILRIDQAVQSSSEDVFTVNISEYLHEYIANKEDVANLTLNSKAVVQVELRGLLLWLVLDNIIANADRFRTSQEAPIELEVLETDSGCRILISNDGPAIAPDKMKTIFNLRYTDSNLARKRDASNRGIGLFISRHYMRMLDGDLKILERTRGVTFEIILKGTVKSN